MLAVTICVLSYFAFQGLEYLSDPLTTTLAYEYQVEETVDLTGYVVRQETVLPDETSGLLQLQRAEGERVSAAKIRSSSQPKRLKNQKLQRKSAIYRPPVL